jgi:hypothetical protein
MTKVGSCFSELKLVELRRLEVGNPIFFPSAMSVMEKASFFELQPTLGFASKQTENRSRLKQPAS